MVEIMGRSLDRVLYTLLLGRDRLTVSEQKQKTVVVSGSPIISSSGRP